MVLPGSVKYSMDMRTVTKPAVLHANEVSTQPIAVLTSTSTSISPGFFHRDIEKADFSRVDKWMLLSLRFLLAH